MAHATNLSTLDRENLLLGYAFRVERDKEISMLCRDAEVRYFNAIRNLRDKFRSAYSCNKDYCPMIKERMEHHIKERHSKPKPSDTDFCPRTCVSTQKIATSSSIIKCKSDSFRFKVLDTDIEEDTSSNDVRDDVIELFKDFPVNPKNVDTKQLKNAIINNLVDKIERLVADNVTDHDKIKTEIDNVINRVLSRYPSKTNEMVDYVNKIRSKLFLIVISQQKKRKANRSDSSRNDSIRSDKRSDSTRVYGNETFKSPSQTLKDEIHDIFKSYPLSTATHISKNQKEKILNNLMNDVSRIANNKTMAFADKKAEVDSLLENLNARYPMYKNDENKEVDNIKAKLYSMLKGKKRITPNSKRNGSVKDVHNLTTSRQSSGMHYNNNSNVTKGVKKLFDDFPILGQNKSKDIKANTMRKLFDDINHIIAKDKVYNEIKVKNDVDNIVSKLVTHNPALKKDAKLKNDIKVKLIDTIKDIYENIGQNGNYRGGKIGNDGNVRPTSTFGPHSDIISPGNDGISRSYSPNSIFGGEVNLSAPENVGTSGNYGSNRNIGLSNSFGGVVNNGANFSRNDDVDTKEGNPDTKLITTQSDSSIPIAQFSSTKTDPKSELRLILESSIYPQIRDERKNSLINNLFHDMYAIKKDMKHKNDLEIKDEINNVIEKLPLWYPGAKRDQGKYINNLRDKLLDFIKTDDKDGSNTSYSGKTPMNDSLKSKLSIMEDSVLTIYTENNVAEHLVTEWVESIKNENFMTGVDTESLTRTITERIVPILHKNSCGKKIILKGAVLETLSDIPATFKCNMRLQKLVNEFVNNLNYMFRNHPNECCSTVSKTLFFNIYRDFSKINALKKLNECLNQTKIAENMSIRDEIADLILYHSDSVSIEDDIDLENDIIKALAKNTDVSEREILRTAKNITECLNKTCDNKIDTTLFPETKSIAVYTSETDSICTAACPKKALSKLNEDEIDYINKVSGLVRAWMDTLPVQFNAPEEKSFKDAMIAELAGEVMDINKIQQLAPFDENTKTEYLKFLGYKWLHKFNCFEMDEVAPHIDDFVEKVKKIPVAVLTRSHRGTRQMMDNIAHVEGDNFKEHYVPKGIDVLEDEISIWVHEQPTNIFTFNNKTRNAKIHELALKIQPKIANKADENIIAQDVGQWLKKNLKKKKANVDKLKDDLKDRVVHLPQDETLKADLEQKLEEKRLKAELKEQLKNQPPSPSVDDETTDIDRTMKDFLSKFIEHNYEITDDVTKRAFNHLLKRELQKLNSDAQKNVCCQDPTETFILPPDKLFRELEYIKIIADWLQNIPIPMEDSFKRPGNKARIDFILGLSKTLSEVEDERARSPCAMDYDIYTASLIETYIASLPIPVEYNNFHNASLLSAQLLNKLNATRGVIKAKMEKSFSDDSGINDENLGDFLEEFIRLHGNDIADDEAKMEAWSIRLIREIKKVVQATEPNIVTKEHIYKQIVSVPKPGDETLQRFDTELIYIDHITVWTKNMPFKDLNNKEEENMKGMICDLAEYLAGKDVISADDKELNEYLTQWINELPLDRSRDIVIPVLIDQLINRLNRIKEPDADEEILRAANIDLTSIAPKIDRTMSFTKLPKDPGTLVVDAIEKWSKSLPTTNETAKDGAATKMYQKVGEYNTDPCIYNDGLLYETFMKDQIESVVENLPDAVKYKDQNANNNKELIETLVFAKELAKEMSAGDNYKQKLEHTIDASLPNPISTKQTYDPAFEIYKNKLADMFILDNFDHGNDQVKAKYETKILEAIDKYFEGAQHKNSKQLSREEVYNELYSNLFKVPIPNETAVMDEVEKVKTRQVIEGWFEKLPIKETNDLIELLEWDQKLDALTKRVHEIEKTPNSDDKLHKEITKWLNTMPLQPHVQNVNEYAQTLQDLLKATDTERKCVIKRDATQESGKGKGKKSYSKLSNDESTRQNADLEVRGNVSPKKKAADVVVELVEDWCANIPIAVPPGINLDANTIRDELARKIIIKISELNTDPTIFDDDIIYKQTLNVEIERMISEIPTSYTFKDVKDHRIFELIEAINAAKHLFREENQKVTYMSNLNKTVDRSLLSGLLPGSIEDHESEYNALKEEIVENYVQLKYDKGDDESRQNYKQNIQNAVDKFLSEVKSYKGNTLMKRNQLICELNKVPIPNENIIIEEVDEIRMKNEVTEFFNDNSLGDTSDKPVDQIKISLAKKLTAIEVTGHTGDNDSKMVKEINRSIKKLNQDINPEIVESFVNKLKANERLRKRRFAISGPGNFSHPMPQKNMRLKQGDDVFNINASEGDESQFVSGEAPRNLLPKCARNAQECCPCDTKKKKPVCPRPYYKLRCDPKDDPYCYKMPKYCE